MSKILKDKDRNIIIQSLRSGVVPHLGLQHIQVGRSNELRSFVNDIDNICCGGTTFRLVIGEYGSGKTFFLSLVRSIALEKGLVTLNSDLSANKRLYGSNGQARLLLSDLISSMSTRTKQDGHALQNILDRFISTVHDQRTKSQKSNESIVNNLLQEIQEYTGGYTFCKVINLYLEGFDKGDEILKSKVLKWLRAEYTTKTEAYSDLGIREILDDSSFFNALKLYSVLIRKAGYKGFIICLDEMVNLFKITSSISRKANYEEILTILNNTLQGNLTSIGFILGGTPEFLTDKFRGLYSYEALKSRLSENSFSSNLNIVDYNTTVLRLSPLSQEEILLLLKNLRHVYAKGIKENYLLTDDAIIAFLEHCAKTIGESYYRTPRSTIKSFLDLLSLLDQYPNLSWKDIIPNINIQKDCEDSGVNALNDRSSIDNDEDEFASFKL